MYIRGNPAAIKRLKSELIDARVCWLSTNHSSMIQIPFWGEDQFRAEQNRLMVTLLCSPDRFSLLRPTMKALSEFQTETK